jgi:hypothetical protein
MKYVRKFLISFVAGAGSAIGAFIGKECMVMVKNEIKRNGSKKKTNKEEDLVSKKGEEPA